MRPLPVRAVAEAPPFVRGVAIIRGTPVPVVDGAAVLGVDASHPTRFVTLRTGDRQVALAVDEVVGVRRIPAAAFQGLPRLLRTVEPGIVSLIGILDADLLYVLRDTCLIPDSQWAVVMGDERTE